MTNTYPEILPGETAIAYNAFCQFCLLGPDNRSMEKLRIQRGNTGRRHIEQWSADNEWQRRVAIFDAVGKQADIDAYREVENDAREKRRRLLNTYYALVAKSLTDTLSKKIINAMTPNELTAAIRMIVQEQRAEYDEEPITRHDVTSDGKPIIDTAALREEMAMKLMKPQEAERVDDDED